MFASQPPLSLSSLLFCPLFWQPHPNRTQPIWTHPKSSCEQETNVLVLSSWGWKVVCSCNKKRWHLTITCAPRGQLKSLKSHYKIKLSFFFNEYQNIYFPHKLKFREKYMMSHLKHWVMYLSLKKPFENHNEILIKLELCGL